MSEHLAGTASRSRETEADKQACPMEDYAGLDVIPVRGDSMFGMRTVTDPCLNSCYHESDRKTVFMRALVFKSY